MITWIYYFLGGEPGLFPGPAVFIYLFIYLFNLYCIFFPLPFGSFIPPSPCSVIWMWQPHSTHAHLTLSTTPTDQYSEVIIVHACAFQSTLLGCQVKSVLHKWFSLVNDGWTFSGQSYILLRNFLGVENVSFEGVILRGASRWKSKKTWCGIGLATQGDSVTLRFL